MTPIKMYSIQVAMGLVETEGTGVVTLTDMLEAADKIQRWLEGPEVPGKATLTDVTNVIPVNFGKDIN